LLCARLEVPKLLFRRAFRGGSLQIRDTQSEPDGDSDEIDSECDLDATAGDDGKTSMVPLEDELSSDESDVIGWDESDQQCSLTGCDESGLGEDFESRYAMIGALYFAFSWVFIMLIIFC
jgi:hypothetical protein